ncbi:MAG: hypothetical protein GW760_01865 [Legionella sp.]|jgi:hypothetical protein|nr:hypothetical protein [Legionella sp.]
MNIVKSTGFGISTAALLSLSLAHAGTMGPGSTRSFIPFVGGEAAYTWNQIQQLSFNQFVTDNSTKGWGGRLSLGMRLSYSERLSFTSEVGGGYYGNVAGNLDASPTVQPEGVDAGVLGHTNFNIDGYDVLMGAMYQYNKIDIFGKFGFMAQNLRAHTTATLSAVIPGGTLSKLTDVKQSVTQILPEIKVGGIYNVNENWGMSLAYMHVFGSSMKTNKTMIGTNTTLTMSNTQNNQNPTLDSIMFGLMYSIA